MRAGPPRPVRRSRMRTGICPLTSRPRLGQQLVHDVIVGRFLGDPRILDQLLLDRDTDLVLGQQFLELFESLKQKGPDIERWRRAGRWTEATNARYSEIRALPCNLDPHRHRSGTGPRKESSDDTAE